MKSFTEIMAANKSSERHAKQLTLGDGTKLSIQASEYHYCSPRITLPSYEEYTSFEIGFPSRKIDELMRYAEDDDNPTGTVYGYVPKEVIEALIESTGEVSVKQD